jgi:hypothetical protein
VSLSVRSRGHGGAQQVKGVVLRAIEIDLPQDDTCVRGGIPNNRELIGRSGNGEPAAQSVCASHIATARHLAWGLLARRCAPVFSPAAVVPASRVCASETPSLLWWPRADTASGGHSALSA